MKIGIYDPTPHANSYLTWMFYGPLRSFYSNHGTNVEEITNLQEAKDSIICLQGSHLSPAVILDLKNNGNKIVCFDINDSSWLETQYAGSSESELIDLIFKVSGIPIKNETEDVSIDEQFGISTSEVKFLEDEKWSQFERMKPRIKSLPYVMWQPISPASHQVRPFNERSGRSLIRGGNHFLRVVLYFRMMQQGFDDVNSGFTTSDYFKRGMDDRFRYCKSCVANFEQNGRATFGVPHSSECNSPASWGREGEFAGGPKFGIDTFGRWNNRCPASFYWLAEQYEKNRGPLNHAVLEKAFSSKVEDNWQFSKNIEKATFASDYKWVNSIYAPPRFWEAAVMGTVNLLPKRVADQEYFPALVEGEHYVTFPNDMSVFDLDIGEEKWDVISKATKALYEEWIRGTEYTISTKLLEHMVTQIEEKTT